MRYIMIAVVLILAVIILAPIIMAMSKSFMRWWSDISDEILEDTPENINEYDSPNNYDVPDVVTLKHDIVIPAGTNMTVAPTKTERYTPAFEHTLAFGPDHTGSFIIDLEAIQRHPGLFIIDQPYDENEGANAAK